MNNQQPTVYSYVRFSTKKQEDGSGQARQESSAAKWCAERGYRLFQNYADLGVSAYEGKNASADCQLGKFLELIRDGKIAPGSILLVESLDRLSRNTITRAAQLFLSLVNAGIKVVTLCDGAEFSEKSCDIGQLIMSLSIFVRANDESKMKSQRKAASWKFKRQAVVEHGKPHGGNTPTWIKAVNGKYEVIESEAKKVRQIFAEYIGGAGLYTLKKRHGIPQATMAYWLNSPTAIGTVTLTEDGHPVEVKHHYPPIIDEATFKKAQAIKSGRYINRQKGKTGYVNLFAGIMVDNKGERFELKRQYGQRLFVSINGLCINARYLEQHICLDHLRDSFKTTRFIEQVAADPRLDAVDAKIKNIQQEMTQDTGIVAELMPVLKELKRQRQEIEANQQTTTSETVDYKLVQSLLADETDTAARSQMREIVRDTIERITITGVESNGWYLLVRGEIQLKKPQPVKSFSSATGWEQDPGETETVKPFRFAYCSRRIGYLAMDGTGASGYNVQRPDGKWQEIFARDGIAVTVADALTPEIKDYLHSLPLRHRRGESPYTKRPA